MAYSELVKSFERIRNYMREFYVYGFKSRDEYGMKSTRSYDNERRRIESWLGDYMSFRQESSGKNVFLSLDSRRVQRNPLYKAFKAKSFTDKDITLHFYILDILADGSALSSKEIVDRINDNYLSHFNGDFSLDESTVRKKLKEYEELGLLHAEKRGREVLYQRSDDASIDLDSWADALAFYSEADPLGVVGSFLMDKIEKPLISSVSSTTMSCMHLTAIFCAICCWRSANAERWSSLSAAYAMGATTNELSAR